MRRLVRLRCEVDVFVIIVLLRVGRLRMQPRVRRRAILLLILLVVILLVVAQPKGLRLRRCRVSNRGRRRLLVWRRVRLVAPTKLLAERTKLTEARV